MPSLKDLPKTKDKALVFSIARQALAELGLKITELNDQRPWGGYLVIDPAQTAKFIQIFFADFALPGELKDKYLSPKIMLWQPGELLSWQYHQRRFEYWKVVKGPVAVYLSATDNPPAKPQIFTDETTVEVPLGVRHRGKGLGDWGVVAEIWGHTDPTNLSTEEDIIRIADKYNRHLPDKS